MRRSSPAVGWQTPARLRFVIAGRVLILNGTTSSGKTTLALNLRARFASAGVPWIVIALDDFFPKLPPEWFRIGEHVGTHAEEGMAFELVDGEIEIEIAAIESSEWPGRSTTSCTGARPTAHGRHGHDGSGRRGRCSARRVLRTLGLSPVTNARPGLAARSATDRLSTGCGRSTREWRSSDPGPDGRCVLVARPHSTEAAVRRGHHLSYRRVCASRTRIAMER